MAYHYLFTVITQKVNALLTTLNTVRACPSCSLCRMALGPEEVWQSTKAAIKQIQSDFPRPPLSVTSTCEGNESQ